MNGVIFDEGKSTQKGTKPPFQTTTTDCFEQKLKIQIYLETFMWFSQENKKKKSSQKECGLRNWFKERRFYQNESEIPT